MTLQRFVAALLIVAAMIVVPVSPAVQIGWTQTEAGFLDYCTGQCRDPQHLFGGSSWYCLDSTSEWDEGWQQWVPVIIVVAGPFGLAPDCNGY